MINCDNISAFEMIYIIVNYGMGSKVLHKAKEHGITGGTIYPGKGTVSGFLANLLSLYDERKEIVLLGADSEKAEYALSELNKDFHFEKPHHGIAFTTAICEIIGSRTYKAKENDEKRGAEKTMYQNIITIVNRGMAEDVIDAAKLAGSKGGTIINARGSSVHEHMKLFNMDIEPEKEIVMILAKVDIADAIVTSIREKLDIDKPGNGIIFVQNVNNVYGIYE